MALQFYLYLWPLVENAYKENKMQDTTIILQYRSAPKVTMAEPKIFCRLDLSSF